MTDYPVRGTEPQEDAKVVRLQLTPAPDPSPAVPPPDPPGPGPSRGHRWDEPPERKPLIPHWLSNRDSRNPAIRWMAGHVSHKAAFHGLRSPLYGLRILACVPIGFGRVTHSVWSWVFDREGHGLRVAMVAAGDAKQYATLARIRRDRVRHRLTALAGLAVCASAVTVTAVLAWAPSLYLLPAAVLLLLAWAGRSRGNPIVKPAVVQVQTQKLTEGTITAALGTLGISEVNKWLREGRVIPMWIGRDGPGWRADIDLPPGVTAGAIMDKRAELASGLRRAVGCVWPEPAGDEHHAGRLVLFVADVPMSKGRQRPWPLARTGRTSMFSPIPFGTDQRGRVVTITLMYWNMLIGAIMRMGKTFALRVIVLFAALDPACEMHVFDLKGTGDLSCVQKLAHRYGCGPDDGTLAACMESIREVYGYLAPRAKTISQQPVAICPENKVTPELAARKSLGLHPVLLAIDEVHELFESDFAKEAESLLAPIQKRGPALGIMLTIATQRPDAKSMPKRISALAGIRFCLRIVDEPSNNMILGAGMYAAGVRATMFTASDKGVGWLTGHSDEAQIARTFYMDAEAAEKIGARAYAARAAAGTLSGDAADEPPLDVSLLRDVLEVMTEDRLWLDTVAGRLDALRPKLYGSWDGRQLGSALRLQGITPQQLKREGTNRWGVDRALIAATLRGQSGSPEEGD